MRGVENEPLVSVGRNTMTPLTLNIGLKPKPAPRPRGKGPVHNPADYTAWKTAFGFLALEHLRIALRNGQPMPSAAAPRKKSKRPGAP